MIYAKDILPGMVFAFNGGRDGFVWMVPAVRHRNTSVDVTYFATYTQTIHTSSFLRGATIWAGERGARRVL